ncbi:EAL domain-containing protein, partial [Vibrio rotiferianus]
IEKIIQVMEEIRALGIKVSLDDFGSGFSSLNLLARLPIDEVKLDRVFICNMDGSESENILLTIKNIISLCLDLSLEVVVEGIEDKDTETVLKKLGAQNFQGYYYSKPMKISDLEMSV